MGLGLGMKNSICRASIDDSSPTVIKVEVPVAVPEEKVKEMQRLLDMNPKPDVFNILKAEQIGKFCAIFVNYPNCTNYEGNKILVYHGNLKDIISQKVLDPHFKNSSKLPSPMARFRPTEAGWGYAVSLCRMISQG